MKLFLGVLLLALSAVTSFAGDLAKVSGRSITDRDLTNALANFNEGQRSAILSDANNKKELLNKLIEQELLVIDAEKQKLDQDQEYKDALQAFRKQFLSTRVLQKNLASQLNEKAAKKYYEAHPAEFSTDVVHVQHILIKEEKAAKEMLKKAQEPSADFMELAEKYSQDPSAKNNRGDLGNITRDAPFVPEFKNAAFSAKEKSVNGLVKTAYGYHIIKVLEKKVGKVMEFSEVEAKARRAVQEQLISGYVSKLRAAAKIDIDMKQLEKK